nr:1-deoxy-D-xylulose-5-phosphate reductoisomerase [Bacilli bacterium]
MQTVSILGATGSIGTQTLDVLRQHRDRFQVGALTTFRRVSELKAMIEEFEPQHVVVSNKQQRDEIIRDYPKVDILYGANAYTEIAGAIQDALVVNAFVGSMGISPTIKAIEAHCSVALANKETLVAAGQLVMAKAKEVGVRIIPVDSEHSAIAQCLQGYEAQSVERLILTASGGPFRLMDQEALQYVTLADALAHPTWRMGPKITVDSATLMNKGLEVIEAHHLFAMPFDQIDVVVHPQSIIHSLVEFKDGALLAQLGAPDMRVPIQYALLEGRSLTTSPYKRLDLKTLGSLTFESPDWGRFPALRIAYECGRLGGGYPTVMNAANEVAAQAFLRDEISFLSIVDIVSDVLDRYQNDPITSLDDIFAADHFARALAMEIVFERGKDH